MSLTQNVFSLKRQFSHSPKSQQDEDLLKMHKEGFSYQEIANILGISKSTVGRKIRMARPNSQSGTVQSRKIENKLKSVARLNSQSGTLQVSQEEQTYKEENIMSEKIAYLNKQIEEFENKRKSEDERIRNQEKAIKDLSDTVARMCQQIDNQNKMLTRATVQNGTVQVCQEEPQKNPADDKLDTTKKKTGKILWNKVFTFIMILSMVGITTGYLVDTARKFYIQESGIFWGTALAIVFELFILALAIYRPIGRVAGVSSMAQLVSSISYIGKWFMAKGLLVGMCIYSFVAVTTDLDVSSAKETAFISVVSNSDIQAKEKYRDSLIEALKRHTKAGAIGFVSQTEERLEKLNEEIKNMKADVKKGSSGIAEALNKKASATKIYRAIALLINIILGHFIVELILRNKD